MTKKNLMPAIVLTAICAVVAALLGVVNMFTAPIIRETENAAVYESLRVVMPNGKFADAEKLPENAPETVSSIYKEQSGRGYVVTLLKQGYASEIGLTVGIDSNGKVLKAVITKQQETHGQGGFDEFLGRFEGCDGDTILDVELVSKATISSTAIRSAIADALSVLGFAQIEDDDNTALPSTDEEIITYAKQIYPSLGTASEIELPSDTAETVKKIFRDENGVYVAYVVTSTEWVPVESEGVAVFKDGRISGVKLVSWQVGGNGASKPTDSFVASFAGKDTAGLENVELISDVTSSSKSFRDAVKAAMSAVSLPTSEEEIASIASELFGRSAELSSEKLDGLSEFVKRFYKLSDGSGYVAYIITNTNWNKHETESVVALDKNGKIVGIKLLAWNLSPTYEHNNIKGDDFVQSLIGKTDATIGDVELITHVTETSGRLRDAIATVTKATSLPRGESEIFEIANTLFGKESACTDISGSEPPEFVKRIYKRDDGGYFAYIVTNTKWNPLETEAVVAFDKSGEIVGVKLLSWNLSPTYEYNYIKGDDFAQSFVGKNAESAANVELITHVTETSTRLRGAIVSAASVMEFKEPSAARVTGIVILVLAAVAVVAVVIIKRRKRA